MRPPIAPQLTLRPAATTSTSAASASWSPARRRASARRRADKFARRGRHASSSSPAGRTCWTPSSTASLAAGGDALARTPATCPTSTPSTRWSPTSRSEFGGVDILINNAGRSIRRPLAESLDRWHDVERTMALNYYSPLRLIRGFAPGMRERGDGHIINVVHLGRAQRIVAAVRGVQRVEGGADGGQPGHRNRMGAQTACTRRRCSTRW